MCNSAYWTAAQDIRGNSGTSSFQCLFAKTSHAVAKPSNPFDSPGWASFYRANVHLHRHVWIYVYKCSRRMKADADHPGLWMSFRFPVLVCENISHGRKTFKSVRFSGLGIFLYRFNYRSFEPITTPRINPGSRHITYSEYIRCIWSYYAKHAPRKYIIYCTTIITCSTPSLDNLEYHDRLQKFHA